MTPATRQESPHEGSPDDQHQGKQSQHSGDDERQQPRPADGRRHQEEGHRPRPLRAREEDLDEGARRLEAGGLIERGERAPTNP